MEVSDRSDRSMLPLNTLAKLSVHVGDGLLGLMMVIVMQPRTDELGVTRELLVTAALCRCQPMSPNPIRIIRRFPKKATGFNASMSGLAQRGRCRHDLVTNQAQASRCVSY